MVAVLPWPVMRSAGERRSEGTTPSHNKSVQVHYTAVHWPCHLHPVLSSCGISSKPFTLDLGLNMFGLGRWGGPCITCKATASNQSPLKTICCTTQEHSQDLQTQKEHPSWRKGK